MKTRELRGIVLLLSLLAATPVAGAATKGSGGVAERLSGAAAMQKRDEVRVHIVGAVQQPVSVSLAQLARMPLVDAQMADVMRDGGFAGNFAYRGVPLRTLLELAVVGKGETGFPSPIDLVVRVRGADGHQTVLSWGELALHNPSVCLLAIEAQPVLPMRPCDTCHKAAVEYDARVQQYHRQVGLPKLVIAGDQFGDRCIEQVTTIEVMEAEPVAEVRKDAALHSEQLVVRDAAGKTVLQTADLQDFTRTSVRGCLMPACRGYHGIHLYEGVSLRDLLAAAHVEPDLDSMVLVTATDGYRCSVSAGELLLNPLGGRIMLVDRVDGKIPATGGLFQLVFPDDLLRMRMVSAVQSIEIVRPGGNPTVYVIGVGPGDTDLITLHAISTMARADAYVCPPDIRTRFARYMNDSPVLFDLYAFAPPVLRKKHPELNRAERNALMQQQREEGLAKIRKVLAAGNSVAVLE